MSGLVKKLLVGATLAAGVTALASAPAKAGTLTGASITGVNGTDYYLYDANTTNTFRNNAASLSTILTGNSSSPTGNVELFANSEALNNTAFNSYSKVTTLSGLLGGRSITLSSLTAADWATNVGGGLTLAQKWFKDALTNNGLGSLIGTTTGNTAYTSFLASGGRQRFSDANISYVNQNDTTGQISIGLAGHLDAKSLLLPVVPTSLQPLLAGKTIQASEIVKVSYDGGPAQYLYNFSATNSGLVEQGDGISHRGNYELLLAGIPPEKVPEPSAMLGLMGLGGFLAAKRKMKNA
ncbi:MAG: NF038130 family PEP-CTERM protein [Oscillatoria princeps RMCB-10]|jgi:hypothetical protein|nr:NF038130 family PEP-CTERM protein [Oscillatoria princeps RMCB-10]